MRTVHILNIFGKERIFKVHLQGDESRDYAENVAQEILKTEKYLKNLKMIAKKGMAEYVCETGDLLELRKKFT